MDGGGGIRLKKVWVIIAGFACALIIAFFIKANWIPEKYAVRISECKDYEPYILVQEAHHTGTGWVQVGDESGYFLAEAYKDIELTNGDVLPLMDMYDKDYVNTFLCKVEYRGTVIHDAFENEIASYDILEWYPVYPVLRDTILPDWMYPKGFMAKREIGE